MLSPKEQLFVQYYHAEGETFKNATKSAIAAGFKAHSAGQAGSRLLKKANVRAAVDAYVAKICEELELSAKKVLTEIGYMAFYDPADIAGKVKGPDDIAGLPEPVRKAIVGWGWDKAGNFVVKLSPKTPSQELLGRHLKLFTDKLEVEVGEGLAESIQAARQRAKGRA